MGKVKRSAPDCLTLNLFAPGMTMLHRAGLGGLACTLRAMERQLNSGLLASSKLPASIENGKLPWGIDDHSVALRFGKPEHAGEYFKRLFEFAFQIKDGVIYLPGQFPDPPPPLAVRAELQSALSRTLLQGAKKNLGVEKACPYFVDADGSGTMLEIEFQRCTWYKHQQEWTAFIDKRSATLLDEPKSTNVGSFNPGAILRHAAPGFADSGVTESAQGLLSSIFFLVACIALRHSTSGDGVLIVPEVTSLHDFVADRPYMTPGTVGEVRVGGAADAVLRLETKLRVNSLLDTAALPSCSSLRFSLRTWTKPQKSRVNAVVFEARNATRVEPAGASSTDRLLVQFEIAMAELPRGVRVREETETIGAGARKRKVTKEVGFWVDSIVRPHIAENLATGGRWYDRFDMLFRDHTTLKRIGYERGGLKAMAKNRQLTDDEESLFIAAIHRAIFLGRGRIYHDTMGPAAAARREPASHATRNRWEKFMERIRLGLVGAKTETQAQSVINELLGRYGTIKELRDAHAVETVRKVVFDTDWQRARNLALFALASYQRPPTTEPIAGDDDQAESK